MELLEWSSKIQNKWVPNRNGFGCLLQFFEFINFADTNL